MERFYILFFLFALFILHLRESELQYIDILDGTSALAWELSFPRCLATCLLHKDESVITSALITTSSRQTPFSPPYSLLPDNHYLFYICLLFYKAFSIASKADLYQSSVAILPCRLHEILFFSSSFIQRFVFLPAL